MKTVKKKKKRTGMGRHPQVGQNKRAAFNRLSKNHQR